MTRYATHREIGSLPEVCSFHFIFACMSEEPQLITEFNQGLTVGDDYIIIVGFANNNGYLREDPFVMLYTQQSARLPSVSWLPITSSIIPYGSGAISQTKRAQITTTTPQYLLTNAFVSIPYNSTPHTHCCLLCATSTHHQVLFLLLRVVSEGFFFFFNKNYKANFANHHVRLLHSYTIYAPPPPPHPLSLSLSRVVSRGSILLNVEFSSSFSAFRFENRARF